MVGHSSSGFLVFSICVFGRMKGFEENGYRDLDLRRVNFERGGVQVVEGIQGITAKP
jgi:hypothetical protein